jgi:hypothetical protein
MNLSVSLALSGGDIVVNTDFIFIQETLKILVRSQSLAPILSLPRGSQVSKFAKKTKRICMVFPLWPKNYNGKPLQILRLF